MRKLARNQIVKLLPTVWDGVEYSKNAKPETAKLVLCDCFNALNTIANALKTELTSIRFAFYEDLLKAIKIKLENYDNFISAVANESGFSVLKQQFELIITELNNEKEVKLEIVFMPYKASMWDCLESIWRAANVDPSCNAYVIPIPYYERNPDHSFGELQYEGKLFPADVPITHYSGYDIAARRPDVIYIHNPFDGNNFVTSVDPRYYSYELKKYTEMLVYVPYFYTGDSFPEAQMNLTVYQYMNKMIVQSDKAKKQLSNYIPEHKLLALGSPKADRTIYCQNNKAIPSEWADIINDKKVVMYNVSISGILQYDTKCIEKIKYVFNCFANKKDVILLWRPHPLIKSTLKSMRPYLYEQYIKLEEAFISENIGILDTTPDVNMAVAIADAYLGEDSSSVVQLFNILGKPIFLTNMNIVSSADEDAKCAVHFLDCDIKDGYAWYISEPHTALCKMDLKTAETEVIAQLNVESSIEFPFCDVKKIDNKIYLLPYNAKELYIFDLQRKNVKKILIKDPAPSKNFDRLIHYNNYLFLKPKSFNAVVRFDINTDECTYYNDCINEFLSYRETENDDIFLWAVCVRDNLILMASSITNKVLEFNMDTGEHKIYTVGSANCKYFSMAFDGNDYWLTPYASTSLVKWNYETGKFTEYNNYPEGFVHTTLPETSKYFNSFISIISSGKHMLLFSDQSNMNLKIDIETTEISRFDFNVNYVEGQRKSCLYTSNCNYYFAKKIDVKHIAALTAYDDSLVIIDTKTEECNILKCRISSDNLIKLQKPFNKYLGDLYSISSACREDINFITINNFIDYIGNDYSYNSYNHSEYNKFLNNSDGTCGYEVNKAINKLVYEAK